MTTYEFLMTQNQLKSILNNVENFRNITTKDRIKEFYSGEFTS